MSYALISYEEICVNGQPEPLVKIDYVEELDSSVHSFFINSVNIGSSSKKYRHMKISNHEMSKDEFGIMVAMLNLYPRQEQKVLKFIDK